MSIIFLHSAHNSVFLNTLINTELINRRRVLEKKKLLYHYLLHGSVQLSYPLISDIFRSCECLDSETTDAVSDFETAVELYTRGLACRKFSTSRKM